MAINSEVARIADLILTQGDSLGNSHLVLRQYDHHSDIAYQNTAGSCS